MRLLHTADFHFGKKTHGSADGGINSRLRDIEQSVSRVRKTATEHKVDGIIIAGDVFEHSTPTPTQQRVAIDSIKTLIKVAPVFMITGNHDHPVTRGLKHANDVFREIDGVTLIDRPTVTSWQGLNIAALPWPIPEFLENGDSIVDKYKALVEQAVQKDGLSIAVGHFTCRGSLPSGSERSLEMSSEALFGTDMFEGLDYTALGHIHKHQEVGPNVVYSGAPERFTFGENTPKGSVIVEFNEEKTTWEFVEHPASKFVVIEVEAVNNESPTSVIIEEIKKCDVKDAFVHIKYRSSFAAQITPIVETLREQKARQLIKLDEVSQEIEVNGKEVEPLDGISERDLVEAYMDERKIPGPLKEKSLALYDMIRSN